MVIFNSSTTDYSYSLLSNHHKLNRTNEKYISTIEQNTTTSILLGYSFPTVLPQWKQKNVWFCHVCTHSLHSYTHSHSST